MMKIRPFSQWLLLLEFVLALLASGEARASDPQQIARGQYIFALAGGCACHTPPKGIPLAGGRAFPIPFGTAYSTNLTQDKETGLGNWTDGQIREAIVKGIRPDGNRILPVMPYEAYSGMATDDLNALVAYLRTLKPVRNSTPPMKSLAPFARSLGVPVWLKLFGRPSPTLAAAPQQGLDRGRYLVEHVSLCGDCHTPRNFLGAPKRSLYLAGSADKNGPLGQDVPNITPDKDSGIGDWKREDIVELLLTGTKPDLDNVQGLMSEVIEQGFKNMKKEDALAIADYLKSVPPIKNKISD